MTFAMLRASILPVFCQAASLLRVFTPARPGSRASFGQEASALALGSGALLSGVLNLCGSLRLGHQHTVRLESSKPRRLHQARESRGEILLAPAGDVLTPVPAATGMSPFANTSIALCLR